LKQIKYVKILKRDLKIDIVVLSGSNYVVWAPDMETLLKSKGPWKYTKTAILVPTDDYMKLTVNGKKDEVVGVIMTYISWEIRFNTTRIDCPHQVWKNLKSLFKKVDDNHVM